MDGGEWSLEPPVYGSWSEAQVNLDSGLASEVGRPGRGRIVAVRPQPVESDALSR